MALQNWYRIRQVWYRTDALTAMPKVPKYRHRADRNYAFVEVGGRRQRLPGAYDSPESRAAYHEFCHRLLLQEGDAPPPKIDGQPSVAELVAACLDWAEGYYYNPGSSSEYDAIRQAAQPMLRLHAKTPASEFGPLALKQVRQAMVDRGWARGHINQQIHRIRRIFRWGVENELVPPAVLQALKAVGPLRAGKTLARETEPVKPPPAGAVEATLPHLTPVLADMVRLQQATGMRSENLCLLRPCDVDRSGDVWLFRPAKHKRSHAGGTLLIPLGPRAQAVLGPYLERDPEAYCFSPRESEAQRSRQRRAARKTPLQPSQASRQPKPGSKRAKRSHYDSRSYRRAIWYAIRRANRQDEAEAAKAGRQPRPIPHWHPHQLRHAVATEVRQRFGLEGAQVYLGHAHAAVTEIYAESDLARAREIARQLG